MRIDLKIMLCDERGRPFMGIGVLWLLRGIEQHGSISAAAREMELSYPKALRMLSNLERGLGQEIVLRRKGGSRRGGAELTPQGRDFVRRYAAMQQELKRLATTRFEKLFAAPLARGGSV